MTAEVAQIGYARINIMTDVGYATRQWYVNNGMAVNDQYRGLDFFTRALHPDDRHLITDFREAAKRGENPKLQALVRVNKKTATGTTKKCSRRSRNSTPNTTWWK